MNLSEMQALVFEMRNLRDKVDTYVKGLRDDKKAEGCIDNLLFTSQIDFGIIIKYNKNILSISIKGDFIMPRKVYVEVIAKTTVEGKLIPLSIKWEDGLVYEIDKILDTSLASSKVGGDGTRYTCRINFKQTYLFKEHDRWFVEGK